MTDVVGSPPCLTRRLLIFGLGSVAGAGAISPALAAVAATAPPSGSESRVS